MLIDTHAHLGDPAFDSDRGGVLQRAADAGILQVVAVGETLADARRNLELTEDFPSLLPTAGLYPTILDLSQALALEEFIILNAHRLAAIGEVGLDYWKVQEEPDRLLQREIFIRFIQLSRRLSLPLNVHSRSAGRETIALLLEQGASLMQLHAFDGRAATAMPAVEAGCFFSIPPSVVRSRQKQKLVKALPVECLLLETDSPALGPEPQLRNEPANAVIALSAIAEIKGLPLDYLIAAIEENQERLYGSAADVG